MTDKVRTLSEAIATIPDGSTIAVGGHTLRRHPMAALRELVRQRKRDLTVLGWNNGIDFDLLAGADVARVMQTSYVGMSMWGLARNFRRAVEAGRLEMWEDSETTALDRFMAGSLGLPFFPSRTPLKTGLAEQPDVAAIQCPFTHEPLAALKAHQPDVAIIHGHVADEVGNIQYDDRRLMEGEADIAIAKSAKVVIVTVEQIVSRQTVRDQAHLTRLPGFFVDQVVEVPYGAHPCACDTRYDYDVDHIEEYYQASRSPEAFSAYLSRYVYDVADEWEYLDRIGTPHLLALSKGAV